MGGCLCEFINRGQQVEGIGGVGGLLGTGFRLGGGVI